SYMMGHSLGEYVAATLAGTFELSQALRLIPKRGELVGRIEGGAMLSVGASEKVLLEMDLPVGLSIAAINSPDLCTLSGTRELIEVAHKELSSRNIDSKIVPITVPAHSSLLDGILGEFRELIQQFKLETPKLRFLSNVS